MASQRYTCNQIHQSTALLFMYKAGELLIHRILTKTADFAEKFFCLQIKQIGVLIILANRHRTLGILVEYIDAAVSCHVISGNGCLILIGRHVHIHTLEIESSNFKIEVGVVHDGIRLATGGTTDIVHGAILAHLTVGHGRCAGIAVIVAGEVEVDTGRVTSRRNVLLIDLTAAGGIGIIGWDMRHQNLPCA